MNKKSLLFVLACTSIVQMIDSKKFRGIMSDEILEYIPDKSIPLYTKYFSRENLILEQIDDDNFFIGGYIECIKSMDKNIPLSQTVRTQFFRDSKWNEGQIQMVNADVCSEYTNSDRFFYKFTKLWTSDLCPPQKGDKWVIDNQTLTAIFDVPSLPAEVPWRGFMKLTQGLPGMEKLKMGVGVQLEFIPA